ncbi:(S)-2-hydroxy-acid oxidase [Drepanopeziza brunnea f. sp. 'multigermtubi' MB_m1]|uniref:(S)-2-hydroxy-acid oxidase n=1 Tax=Marssonina brunnea f. sp. multigermtubi (strain MB_m1) TaxID=1072389 RepID=K1WVE1_MARBU|nr:(S)-2-hydroxy-acid oxidase [Drepanopeziza brunnea f. sp. 'multigermtubi' MB_m1]EKD12618.1 (S)-2-hydroxy-acid oxidase [Drepanopeziza brunnea f. sp. 'multigermtubi' MB_m1]
MRSFFKALPFVASVLAVRPFLNEADTGIDEIFGDVANGTLIPLENIVGLPDFEWAARRYLNATAYTYYRNGAGGEWSYRNNLEVYQRYTLRPRVMKNIINIEDSLETNILGFPFSAPIFISPCARGSYGHPEAEAGLVKAAASEKILYIPSLFASLTIEQIGALKSPPINSTNETPQVTMQQVYVDSDLVAAQKLFNRVEAAGGKAIIYTVDSAGDGNRHRAVRYGVGSADSSYSLITWETFHTLQNLTSLPIIPKGIMTVEDAQDAVENGCKAIILSNHGGRQVDGAPSSLEVALEIYQKAPEVFKQTEVYADGGVRYGTDVLKLLSLGVKAVGVGRPMMYANVYGEEGVTKAIQLLKKEIALDAANLGIGDLKKIDASYVNWNRNNWYS